MIRLATIEQIRAIEEAADSDGYSYADMMDNAGRAAADRASIILKDIDEAHVTVLVGAGNNGGDGLVAGLYIAEDNPDASVRFYILSKRDDDSVKSAIKAGLSITYSEDDEDKHALGSMIARSDLVIDALFGIGVRLPLKGEVEKILKAVNQAIHLRRNTRPEKMMINPAKSQQIPSAPPIYVLAIDCPSGMDCDTGEIDSNIIQADETITFIAAKQGQLRFPGAGMTGKLIVADIAISEKLDAVKSLSDFVVDSEWVKSKLPGRGNNGHKGTYGRALIVAGSVNYIGAPALAAEAAYRSGAGLVTVASASPVVMALAGQLREVTWMMLSHDMGVIAEGATQAILKEINKMKSLLIGPGFGTEKTTGEFIESLLKAPEENAKKPGRRKLGFGIAQDDHNSDEKEGIRVPPLVIDADGLNLLAEIDNWWDLLPENTIITPHPGEMARLCDVDTKDVQSNRWQLARDKAKEWGVILMLKGAYTVIASPEGDFAVLPFDVDSLATAGTGDILVGLIVGLLAQGVEAYDAALIAGYVHGLAGQILAETTSSRSVIAGDVLAMIPEAFKQLEG